MKITKTEVVEENGVKYQIDTYESGATVKFLWQDPNAPIPEPEPIPDVPQEMTDNEKIMLALTELYEQTEQLKEDNSTLLMALTDLYEAEVPNINDSTRK